MRSLLTYFLFFTCIVSPYAQVQTQFQSVSSAGTANGQSTNATLKNSGSVGQIVSFGAGQSNRSGFFVGVSELPPSTQATNIVFSSLAHNQLTITWTNGNGNKRLVLAHAGAVVDAIPVYGATYTANAAFGSGSQIGTGNFVVYNGTGSTNTVTVTALSPSVIYHFQVFEFNGSGLTHVYKTIAATGNPASRTTLAAGPVTQSSALLFSSLTNTSYTLSWTNGNGARRIVLARQGSAVNSTPTSGQAYAANAAFALGEQISTGNYVVYDGSGNNVAITGLNPATTYHYKSFEYNGTDATSNYLTTTTSNIAQQLTLTNPTVSADANPITQNSFVASWIAVTGATNYSIDVSTNSFGTFVSGYNNQSVAGISTTVSGLSPGVTYQYRVRANNSAGASANSNIISLITISATPVLNTPTAPTQTSFTVSWNAVVGVDNYRLDISTDNNFANFLPGYQDKQLTATSESVLGLSPGTIYYIRLRTNNISGTSPNSVVVSQITVPAAPTGLSTSGVTSSVIVASWSAVIGADSYEVDVSKDNFTTVQTITTTDTSEPLTGLIANTVYKYRIRAVNVAGKSPYTTSLPTPTLDASGSSNPLAIGTSQFSSPISSVNGTGKASVQTTGGYGTVSVKFKHRKITETSWVEEILTLSGNKYEATITSAMSDELGLEFYFVASDDVGPIETPHDFIYLSIDAASGSPIPFTSNFDGKSATYQMFSVPYVITEKNIANVFDELGAYDKTQWRLFHYQNNKYAENLDGLNNIEIGRGYWFNTKEKLDIKPGAGEVVKANQTAPFTLSFDKGWNQIGNPYAFNIDWETIKDANLSAGLNSLWLYEGSKYVKKDVLATWKGAFVFSDNGGTVSFPVTAKTSSPGRIQGQELSNNIDEPAWQVPITLYLNGLEQTSRIGMHPEARNSKDRFDEITIPRFVDYLEMETYHKEFFAPNFASDVVPTANESSWLFTVSSSQKDGEAILSWDQQALFNSQSNLAFIDLQGQTFVDMKTVEQYRFRWRDGSQFKFLYSKEGELLAGVTMLGNAYPNPFDGTVTIPYVLEEDQSSIEVRVYDLLGRKVKTLGQRNVKAGIQSFEWNGTNDQGSAIESGLYLYQLRGDNGILSQPKRLIKQ